MPDNELGDIKGRLGELKGRLDSVEKRVDGVEQKLYSEMKEIRQEISKNAEKNADSFKEINEKFDIFGDRLLEHMVAEESTFKTMKKVFMIAGSIITSLATAGGWLWSEINHAQPKEIVKPK
jgi:type I site-specific restriction endonuclease